MPYCPDNRHVGFTSWGDIQDIQSGQSKIALGKLFAPRPFAVQQSSVRVCAWGTRVRDCPRTSPFKGSQSLRALLGRGAIRHSQPERAPPAAAPNHFEYFVLKKHKTACVGVGISELCRMQRALSASHPVPAVVTPSFKACQICEGKSKYIGEHACVLQQELYWPSHWDWLCRYSRMILWALGQCRIAAPRRRPPLARLIQQEQALPLRRRPLRNIIIRKPPPPPHQRLLQAEVRTAPPACPAAQRQREQAPRLRLPQRAQERQTPVPWVLELPAPLANR